MGMHECGQHSDKLSEMHKTHRSWGSFPSRSLLGRLGLLLELQGVQFLLAFMGHSLNLVDWLGHIKNRRRRRWNSILSAGRLLFDRVPPVLAGLLPLLGTVLLFSVLMRALVKELRVDFHEHLHGIVHHAVDSPVTEVVSID